MRIILFLTCMTFCALVHGEESRALESIVGLWQFPDREVWIRIEANGSAFQCRRASDGTIYTSRGKYVSPDTIRWEDIWGTDDVAVEGDAMTLNGKYGKFSYRKAKRQMLEGCRAQ